MGKPRLLIMRRTRHRASSVGFQTHYNYDTLGNLTKVTNAYSMETDIFHDSLSRKIAIHDKAMGNWTYGYDDNGNLRWQKDAKLNSIEFHYDALNRPVTKEYRPLGVTPFIGVEYAYDDASVNGIGRLRSVTDKDPSGNPICVTGFVYDPAGRVTSSSTTVGSKTYTFQKSYYAAGQTESITYPDGLSVGYEYDRALNLARVFNGATGDDYAAFSGYTAAGQPQNIAYGNDVATSMQYFPRDKRPREMTTTAPGGLALQHFSYLYDSNGSIKSISDLLESARDQQFAYDGLNRLDMATSQSYATLIPAADDTGNITSSVDNPPAPGTIPNRSSQTVAFDYDNRVASITNDSGTTAFVYNYQGARIKKTSTYSNSETVYVGKLLEDSDGADTRHIFAGGRRIASMVGGQIYYYHPDHLGSLNVATDADGAVAQRVTYYPYGEIRTNAGAVDLPFKFTGQEYDSETGLYYYGARYYDPAIGRFISPDSFVQNPGDPQALNRYAYCRNNPLNLVDPKVISSSNFL